MNPGFETPYYVTGLDAFGVEPTGAGVGWTFVAGPGYGGGGISGNGTYLSGGNPDAPEGVQAAFLQGTSSVSQSIIVTAAGSLTVAFQAAQRATGSDPGSPQPNVQEIQVSLGSTIVGTFTPSGGGSGADYQSLSTTPISLVPGTYALTFAGLNPQGGDNMAFVDAVTLSFTPSAGGNALADNPFGYLGGLGYWQDPSLADSGLSYVRQRWLENASGQWLSVDPMATEPRYSYAHNSPTIKIDPGGMQTGDVPRNDWQYLTPRREATAPQARKPATGVDPLYRIVNRVVRGEIARDIAGAADQARQSAKILMLYMQYNGKYRGFLKNYKTIYMALPQQIRRFAPDPVQDFSDYFGAFVDGFLDTINDVFGWNALVSTVKTFLKFFCGELSPHDLFDEATQQFQKQILQFLDSNSFQTAEDKGYVVGSLLAAAVSAVIAIIDIVEAVGLAIGTAESLVGLLKVQRLARSTSEIIGVDSTAVGRTRAVSTSESVLMKREVQRTIGKANESLEGIRKRPKAPESPVKFLPRPESAVDVGFVAQMPGDGDCGVAVTAMILLQRSITPHYDELLGQALQIIRANGRQSLADRGMFAPEIIELLSKNGVNASDRTGMNFKGLTDYFANQQAQNGARVIVGVRRQGYLSGHAVIVDGIIKIDDVWYVSTIDPYAKPFGGLYYQNAALLHEPNRRTLLPLKSYWLSAMQRRSSSYLAYRDASGGSKQRIAIYTRLPDLARNAIPTDRPKSSSAASYAFRPGSGAYIQMPWPKPLVRVL